MSKTLEQELYQYILKLDEAEKKSILQMLKTFVKGREGQVSRISVEEYNQEVQEAEAEYERGEYSSHEEFVKQKLLRQYKKRSPIRRYTGPINIK